MRKSSFRKCLALSIIAIFFGFTLTSSLGTIYSTAPVNKLENIETFDYYPNGISEKIFDRLIEALMSLAQMSSISAAIVKDNELVWAKGYGLYDRENNKETNEEVIYLVASISKTFTATAIMQLYEQGYFDLDDDVNDYLNFNLRNPKYPEQKITFRMLLAHRSSIATDLPTYFTRAIPGDLEISGYPYPYFEELLTPNGIHYRPQIWKDFPPGEEIYYANIGFGVLGYLVEMISGQTFEEYCKENIFEPLKMNDTSFRLLNVNVSRVAVPYESTLREYIPYIHYNIIEYPAGGLRTSVLDLSHFLIAHMNQGTYDGTQILTPESVEEMHTIQFPSDHYNFQYGLGFQIWETKTGNEIGHTGGLYGVGTKMKFKESDDVGIIMFINKAIGNLRDRFVFSLIENLLFMKAKGFSTFGVIIEDLMETMYFNQFLSKDFDVSTNNNLLISYR